MVDRRRPGLLASLLSDPCYLLYTDPQQLAHVLSAIDHHDHVLGRLYWRALDRLRTASTPAARAAALQDVALREEPDAIALLQTDGQLPWRGLWTLGHHSPFHRRLIGHVAIGNVAPIRALCIGTMCGRTVVVSGGEDRTVRVWDAQTGELQSVLTGHSGPVNAVAIGSVHATTVVVSGSSDHTVRIWDAVTGQPYMRTLPHKAPVSAVALGVIAGRSEVVSGSNNLVRMWDIETGNLRTTMSRHLGAVTSVAVGQVDRQVVVSGGRDRTVRVWDAVRTENKRRVDAGGYVRELEGSHLEVSPGSSLAGGVPDVVWDFGTGVQHSILPDHPGPVTSVAIGEWRGRSIIASASGDSAIRIWDGRTTGTDPWYRPKHQKLAAVAFGEIDGKQAIAFGQHTNHIDVVAADTGRPWKTLIGGLFYNGGDLTSVAIGSVDGRPVVVSGDHRGGLQIHDFHTGHRRLLRRGAFRARGHTDHVCAVGFASTLDRTMIVSCGREGRLCIWDGRTGKMLQRRTIGTDRVRSASVAQVGGHPVVASSGDQCTVRLSNAAGTDGADVVLSGHTSKIDAVVIGQVGTRSIVASCASDGTVLLWDPARPTTPERKLTIRSGRVDALAIGCLNRRGVLAIGGGDATVWVYDIETGEERFTSSRHTDGIRAIAIGHVDGRALIVAASWTRIQAVELTG